jgi:sugar porter (SP) family MFS transporter
MIGLYEKNLAGAGLRGQNLLIATTIMSGLGFLVVGYDNGLMGGFINGKPWNQAFNNPSSTIIGTVVAIYEVGGFIGSLFTSVAGNSFGRRQCVGTGAICLIIGAILQASSFSLAQLFVGRIISGCGVGLFQSTLPILQSEVSPSHKRGMFATAYLSSLNFGILIAYWLNYGIAFTETDVAWRFPSAFQLVFIIAILVLTFIVPESPRWLILHDRNDDAAEVVSRLLDKSSDDREVRDLLTEIRKAVAIEILEGSGSWKDFFVDDGLQTRRRLWSACLVQIFQQLTGNNFILYYETTIFQQAIGFTPRMASLMSGILNIWFFVFSFAPWFLIDRIGRKPLFLIGTFGQMVAFVISAGMVYKIETDPDNSKNYAIVAAAMLFVFLGSFTFGMQATVWVYPTEVVPLRLRSKGTAISTASNWIFNFLVVEITPPAVANIGYKTYIIFSVFNFVFLFIVFFYFKETKGLSLEAVDVLYAKKDVIENHTLAITEQEHLDAKHSEEFVDERETEEQSV